MTKTAIALALALASSSLFAQEPKPAAVAPAAPAVSAPVVDPAMTGLRSIWGFVKDFVVRAAEKMPEESWSFRPSPDVRTFGQIVAHVADSQYYFAGMVLGEKPPVDDVEKTKTSKADVVAALKASVAYTDRAFALSDAEAAKPVKLFGHDTTKFGVLALVIGHGYEHYGNMVTIMRMKGLVPPSSEPRPAAPARPAAGKK